MSLNARKYVNRNDAEEAGAKSGTAYATVIILILLYMTWADMVPWCIYTTAFLSALILVTLRIGVSYHMGQKWDRYEKERQSLQRHNGMTALQAFEAVRDRKYVRL